MNGKYERLATPASADGAASLTSRDHGLSHRGAGRTHAPNVGMVKA
jgi:hypothetical protein